MPEPTTWARQQAFSILTRHPDCLKDDVSMNDLIDDIAERLDDARICGRTDQRAFVVCSALQDIWLIVTGRATLHRAWQAGHDHGRQMEYTRTVINGGR